MKKHSFSFLMIFLFAVLLLYLVILLLILSWGVVTSLKINDLDDSLFWPKMGVHFENYLKAWSEIRVARNSTGVRKLFYLHEMLGYSLLYGVGCAFLGTLTPCVVGYLVAKYKQKFNKVVYFIVIFTMIVPVVGNLPSVLQVLNTLGLYNTIFGVWAMKASFLGLYFLVFYATYKSISWEYAEAAIIDGAGHFRIMTRIMFPLAKNTIGTVFILLFIIYWNDYMTPLLYMPALPTAAYGLLLFIKGGNTSGDSQTVPMQLAGGVVLMVPILIVFITLHNKIMGNISVGGLKG